MSVCPGRGIRPLLLFLRFLTFFPIKEVFGGSFSFHWIEGLRIEGVVHCTVCKAPWGKLVIFGYINKIDLTWLVSLRGLVRDVCSDASVVSIHENPLYPLSCPSTWCNRAVYVQNTECLSESCGSCGLLSWHTGCVLVQISWCHDWAGNFQTSAHCVQQLCVVRVCVWCALFVPMYNLISAWSLCIYLKSWRTFSALHSVELCLWKWGKSHWELG